MKRWNGWGDTTISYPLHAQAEQFLVERIGPLKPTTSTPLADVLTAVPLSHLPDHPLIDSSAETRLRHARGQSFPDWVALRSGQIPAFPDGVAFPTTDQQVRDLLNFAAQHDFKLIPYGGGTSVVGHINVEPDSRPVLTVSLARLNRLRRFDETSHLATFGAGVAGPDLEAQLRARGFTLGHFPQSFEYSTLGGWVVTRSSGQQSRGYGRIEDLFAGGTLLAPAGELALPPFPATAAGPDLRQLVLGSEGRLGILSEATVRISPLPEKELFFGVFFPTFAAGHTAVRQIMQAKLPVSMLRLSTGLETETNLALAGHENLIGLLERLLKFRGVSDEKAMLLVGLTGTATLVDSTRKAILSLTKQNHGVHVGQQFGQQWQKGRFRTAYLRNTLWDKGVAVDTLETAVTWDSVESTIARIETALHDALGQFDERGHIFTHLSHIYPTGCSIYTTYLFRLTSDPDENLHRWHQCKKAASTAVVNSGGTISHQHGVGKDHAPYLEAEKGALGMAALQTLAKQFDPDQRLTPGTLL
jgi:alkyldihydroxyacetonephosphate synthase